MSTTHDRWIQHVIGGLGNESTVMCPGNKFNDPVFSLLLNLPTHRLKRAVGKKMARTLEGEGERVPKLFVILCAAVVVALCVVGLIDEAPTVQNAVKEDGPTIRLAAVQDSSAAPVLNCDVLTTPEWNPDSKIRVQRLIAQKSLN
jgi:hypothetical protein